MSYHNGPRIVNDGLLFCIDPVSSKNSGSTITDLGSQNCNGTLTNGASISSNYFLLDGTNDYIDFATNNIISNTITIDIWLYISQANNTIIICAGDNVYNSGSWNWSIFACCSGASNNLVARADPGGGGFNLGSINSIFLNQWNNIVITRNNGSFYRNGVLLGSATSSTTSDKVLRIGAAGGVYFNGRIGPVRIYNKSLTSSEILQNYNATKARYGR